VRPAALAAPWSLRADWAVLGDRVDRVKVRFGSGRGYLSGGVVQTSLPNFCLLRTSSPGSCGLKAGPAGLEGCSRPA
jgi:hypothetical protein